ncbi:hypothetical protein [Tenacibaculum amylolyticum]|uniref:hypothetical protein n=1 Tax=Tenacibaculum amylolyticum TaxID=104269 RepID=UPI00389642ED
MIKRILLSCTATILISCNTPNTTQKQEKIDLKIDYEKITLDNGLDVIFHVDKSDPVVAVELMVHVGS